MDTSGAPLVQLALGLAAARSLAGCIAAPGRSTAHRTGMTRYGTLSCWDARPAACTCDKCSVTPSPHARSHSMRGRCSAACSITNGCCMGTSLHNIPCASPCGGQGHTSMKVGRLSVWCEWAASAFVASDGPCSCIWDHAAARAAALPEPDGGLWCRSFCAGLSVFALLLRAPGSAPSTPDTDNSGCWLL